MATIDCEKKYNEALKRAKKLYEQGTITESLSYVFPELAGSEDERIRKALVELVHDTTGDSLWVDYGVHKEDALAWLEKQGEMKEIIPEDATVDSNEDGLIAETIRYKNEKQGEQKPWSEEDELTRNALINLVEMYYGGCIDKSEKTRLLNFLKSLKDRVQPQPKQEWSEEDRNKIADYLYCLNVGFTQTAAKQRAKDICDLLRPQKQWKPSDEQMEYLAKAILTLGNEGDCKTASILNELRTDLKKL